MFPNLPIATEFAIREAVRLRRESGRHFKSRQVAEARRLWVCFDWKERQAVGFFKTAAQADAMTKRANMCCAPVDWGGLPRYQTIEEEDEFEY